MKRMFVYQIRTPCTGFYVNIWCIRTNIACQKE